MINTKLNIAVSLLKSKMNVIPEKYAMYNGAYLFLAYPPNADKKDRQLSPFYLVDLKTNSVGPCSPAFDLDGFFKATERLKSI